MHIFGLTYPGWPSLACFLPAPLRLAENWLP